MFQVPSLVVLLGLALCLCASHETVAQQFSESGVVYEAARNKIGMIRYCRNNKLLDPAVAEQAVTAVETGLRKHPPSDPSVKERGDRAQRAGEDGFWEAGRRRDIASVAKLFRTTPADLCQEWADETLRAKVPRRRREIPTIAVVAPLRTIQPLRQAEPAPKESAQVDRRSVRETAAVRATRSDPPPPLPEKAPLLPIKAEPGSWQRALKTDTYPGSTGRAVPRRTSTPSAVPPSSRQAEPPSAQRAAETPGPLPREQTATGAAPSRYPDDQAHPFWEKWPFNRLGKSDRCLMPGCRWRTPDERRSWRY
jgi:hypothetical protein